MLCLFQRCGEYQWGINMYTKKDNGINMDSYQVVKDELGKITVDLTKTSDESQCFVLKTANAWVDEAKLRPIPKMLFDVFWFENEICILFADTNIGKSILAVQLSESIAKGEPIDGFRLQVKPQKVIYFDFELSDKQFEKRYSNNFKDHYSFSDNLLRAEINPDTELPKEFKSFEEYLVFSIVSIVEKEHPKVLVIDNITYLKSDNEKAKDALPLMKELKTIGKKYNLSILVLAHTPKRDSSKPLTKNDLAGSKMLINFCDSAFAIGESSVDSGIRYLKQIKQRNTECVYDSENVVVSEILQDFNFLKFQFKSYDSEINHLKSGFDSDTEARNQEIIFHHKSGMSNRKIADLYNLSESGIRKILKKLKD